MTVRNESLQNLPPGPIIQAAPADLVRSYSKEAYEDYAAWNWNTRAVAQAAKLGLPH
jgi:hypothetical protein